VFTVSWFVLSRTECLSLTTVDTVLQLYDLHVGRVGEQRNAADGCRAEDDSCGVVVPHKPHGDCGVNGACIGNLRGEARCLCKPGWRGPSCDIGKFKLYYSSYSFEYKYFCSHCFVHI